MKNIAARLAAFRLTKGSSGIQLAGFSLFAVAGYEVSFVAGCLVAGCVLVFLGHAIDR